MGAPERAADRSLSVAEQLAVQYAITRAFAEAEQLDEIAEPVLRTLADAFGWATAALWLPDDHGEWLSCVATYAASDLEEWSRTSCALRFRAGMGLPGRVWQSGEPAWIRDTDAEQNFLRRAAAQANGLRHGFAFPVRVGGSVAGVIELFAANVREIDVDQTQFLEAIAHQLGSFMQRTVARRAVATSEARKAAILAAAVDAIVSADTSGRITEFNAAAERLFGWSTAEAIGRSIADLMPEDLRPQHFSGFRRYLETREPRIIGQRVRTRALHRDGSQVPVELTVTEMVSDMNPMFTAFVRDITVEQQAETARDRFMEILSHELRTPVTAIYGGAKILVRPSLDEPHRDELIRDIAHEADRLHRLIENLIVLARAERGALSMGLEPVHLERVTQRVIYEFAAAGAPPIEMRSSGPGVVALADETHVEQLLRNLISNAVKYGAQRPVDVEISPAADAATLRVLDRGPGIDPVEADRLFEIDYRSPLTNGLAQGSGIGLFVARWLVERMNGRIWASAREGGGSEFGFALPLASPEAI